MSFNQQGLKFGSGFGFTPFTSPTVNVPVSGSLPAHVPTVVLDAEAPPPSLPVPSKTTEVPQIPVDEEFKEDKDADGIECIPLGNTGGFLYAVHHFTAKDRMIVNGVELAFHDTTGAWLPVQDTKFCQSFVNWAAKQKEEEELAAALAKFPQLSLRSSELVEEITLPPPQQRHPRTSFQQQSQSQSALKQSSFQNSFYQSGSSQGSNKYVLGICNTPGCPRKPGFNNQTGKPFWFCGAHQARK